MRYHEPMFGSHLSIAGGLHNALLAAHQLKMQCVQVFTKNQRQWNTPPLTDAQINEWAAHRAKLPIKVVVSHDSYLINLASPGGEIRRKSIDLFREELLRCEALDIPLLVTHPGAHLGEGEDAGLKRIAAALDQLHGELPGLKVVTCLEITAGQGSSLGYRFEHLAQVRALVKAPERLATCMDTAHLLAAGYDLTSAAGCKATLDEAAAVLGDLGLIRCWHLNDSKVPRGKRVDRHDHIGLGHVSLDAFAAILRHRQFRQTPKILETPKLNHPSGRPWDAVNLDRLREL